MTADETPLATGWEPTTPLSEGVGRTIDWYVEATPPERLKGLEGLLMAR